MVPHPAGQILQRARLLLLRLLYLEDLHLHRQHCVRPGGEGGPDHEDVRHPGQLVRVRRRRHGLVAADLFHRRGHYRRHFYTRIVSRLLIIKIKDFSLFY